jgi:hypothetical protein
MHRRAFLPAVAAAFELKVTLNNTRAEKSQALTSDNA